MEVIEWRGKQLNVSSSQIAVIKNDFMVKKSIKTSEHSEGGKTYKNKEAVEPGTISFTLGIYRQLGIEVQAEINAWMSLMEDGGRGALTLAGVNLLGDEVLLKGVEAGKFDTSKDKLIQCEIKLSFEASKAKPAPAAVSSSSKSSKKTKKKKATKKLTTMSGGGALPKTGAAFRAISAAKKGKTATAGKLKGAYGKATK